MDRFNSSILKLVQVKHILTLWIIHYKTSMNPIFLGTYMDLTLYLVNKLEW